MKKLIFSILTISIFFTCIKIYAEAPDTLWTKMFLSKGTMMNGDAVAQFTKQTTDGGFIACGTAMNPFLSAFILKTDANGKELWQKQYYENPMVDGTVTIASAAETVDKGYIMVGHGVIYQQGNGLFLFRIKANGDTLWSKFYNHTIDTIIVPCEIKVTQDEGYIITGAVSPRDLPSQVDMFYMKTDSEGNVLWYRTYGSEEFTEMGISVEPAFEGGYMITSTTDQEYVVLSLGGF